MKSLRNNLVVGVILSLMLSSTAFANPLTTMISGHMKEALALIDTFNKSAEDGDALLARIQDETYAKNAAAYQELRSLSDGLSQRWLILNQRFKDNSANHKMLVTNCTRHGVRFTKGSRCDQQRHV
jgi:hypothetical protein